MKRIICVLLTVLMLAGVTSCHYTRYNLDNVPSLKVVGEQGIEWTTKRLTGFPRKMLIYIWGEPAEVSGNEELWDVSETEVLALTFDEKDRVETVRMMEKDQILSDVDGGN